MHKLGQDGIRDEIDGIDGAEIGDLLFFQRLVFCVRIEGRGDLSIDRIRLTFRRNQGGRVALQLLKLPFECAEASFIREKTVIGIFFRSLDEFTADNTVSLIEEDRFDERN